MKKAIVAGLTLVFALGIAGAEDAAGVLAKLKARDAKMEAEFKDIKLVMDTSMSSGGMDMPSSMQTVVKGKKRRTEVSMMGMKTIVINDGKDIWMIGAQQGKKQLNNENEAGQSPTPFGWSESLQADGLKSSEAEVEGRKCYVLEGNDKKGNNGKWSIDKASLVLVKYEGGNVLLVNSDFKKVKGGYEMPYKMVMTKEGKPLMTSTIKSIEFNKGADDALFNIDNVKQEELGKMDMDAMMKMMQNKK